MGLLSSLAPDVVRMPVSSFRGDAQHRTRNLEIPGLVLTHHPGMTVYGSAAHVPNVQLFSSLVAAITSRSSFGPGTAGLEVKMSH